MLQFNTSELLDSLQKDIDFLLSQLDEVKVLDDQTLNRAPAAGKWSIAQILKHLNTYNR